MQSRKGVPNKPKVDPYKIAQQSGCDPFLVLMHFINGDYKALGYETATEVKYTPKGDAYESDRITPDLRLSAAKEAVKYLYSQHKAIDHSSSDGTALLAPLIIRPSEITTKL